MTSFAFAQPAWLLALLALVPYAIWRRRRRHAARIDFPPLQVRSLVPRGRRWQPWVVPVEVGLLACLLVGIAGPYRGVELELADAEGVDVMLVLDISLSMLAEDFSPNRLEALKRIATAFLGRAGGHRLGIVVFAKDTFVHTPLTTDATALAALLDDVDVYQIDQREAGSGGTAIGDALLVAADRLQRQRQPAREQAIILISDGESNSGIEPTLAAGFVAHHEIRLYAIGVGGDEPVEVWFEGRRVGGDRPYLAVLDDAELEAVAATAGGRYWRATDAAALEEIFGELSRLESRPLELRRVEIRRSGAPRLAALALGLFAFHLLLAGILARRPLR